MKANQIYVSLPVKDIEQTKTFWTNIGFSVNEKITDEKAVCIVMSDNIFVMFITEDYFQTFSERPVPNGDTTQVLVSLAMNSREEVDRIVDAAVENGAYQHEEPQDYGWMYQNSFWDINGHGWNITFADPSQMPE
ncbi:VOC family protein [Chryseobacterium hagamense]|uniref:Extradiol dioxygenase n=1 Tax=Chryseobacterium hagamense TaxID=395935 RepID=A0A511YRP2_9FLAO|nr:VOC family protein [Chryseobacterium hagamense]GEN77863.1 extradiol dioxygenase [Chryseobacterium hagamense]